MASVGHTRTQAPQLMHVSGSMYNISAWSKSGSSGVGWMQLTGQTLTQLASLQQEAVITNAMPYPSLPGVTLAGLIETGSPTLMWPSWMTVACIPKWRPRPQGPS